MRSPGPIAQGFFSFLQSPLVGGGRELWTDRWLKVEESCCGLREWSLIGDNEVFSLTPLSAEDQSVAGQGEREPTEVGE